VLCYLSQRFQFVQYRQRASERRIVTHGVPQGSILGPLLFLLYVNDIANVSRVLSFVLFADDTNGFVSGQNIDPLIEILNGELSKLETWLRVNKLSINLDKTNYMVFKTKNKPCSTNKTVLFSGAQVAKVTSTRFLGVVISENLSWKDHVMYICKKIARSIGIIAKARKVFNKATCLSLYYSFLYPYLMYCIEVWGGTYPTTLTPLVTLQKRALRLVTFSDLLAPSAPLFAETRIIPINKIHQFYALLFVFKFKSNLLPRIFNNFFERRRSRSTRQQNCFTIPRARLTTTQRSIKYTGVKLWNLLITKFPAIAVCQSIHLFKSKLKAIIMLL
jgi:hypothetical protein